MVGKGRNLRSCSVSLCSRGARLKGQLFSMVVVGGAGRGGQIPTWVCP